MERETFVLLGDAFAVFDPVGGAAADHALVIACAAFRDGMRTEPRDGRRALSKANSAINDAIEANPRLRGIGCTAATLVLSDATATIAWVGDAHVFRLRGARFEALTREHSLRNELGLSEVPSNVIVRALGMPKIEVDVVVERVEPGDLFVLASYGVRTALGDTLLTQLVLAHREDSHACTRALLENAQANASKDELTVVIARAGEPHDTSGELRRPRARRS